MSRLLVQGATLLGLKTPWEITDVEINPLRCAPDGVVALDARILVGPPP